jgi:hypothetical protein
LENRICSGHPTFYLFVKPYEKLKPTTVAVFISNAFFATIFAIGLVRRIESGENNFSAIDICGCIWWRPAKKERR